MALLSPAIFPDLEPFFLLDLLRKPIIGECAAPLIHALFWKIAIKRAIPDLENASQRSSFYEALSGAAGPWKLMRLVRWGRPKTVFQQFPSILPKLDCPTLVIHGSRDILPRSFADRAADLIADSRFVEMDSGHFIPIDRALEVSENLVAYFRSHGAETAINSKPTYRAHPQDHAANGHLVPSPAVH